MGKVATWNVNSLRVRLPHLLTWLADNNPDIVALQETKLPDEVFPQQALQNAGYYSLFNGQKTYNGVAFVSKKPMKMWSTMLPEYDDPQRRILLAEYGDLMLLNVYIPNGATIDSDKYAYKLAWLNKLIAWIKELLIEHPSFILLGDFNIAPHDKDVYDPKAWDGKVLVSEPERTAFQNLCEAGLEDCFRVFSQPEQQYSWWDYRQGAFRRGLGMRIDHILASKGMIKICNRCYIDKTPRALTRPSDHTPVIAEFSLN